MSGFDRLGRELEDAAERGKSSAWPQRAGNAGGAAAIVAALATVAVIAFGAVVLLHGRSGHSTSAGSSSYTQGAPGAQVAAWTRLLRCSNPTTASRLSLPGATVALSNAAPDPRLVARLGVLRGPWTAADEAPSAKCQGFDAFLGQTLDIRYVRYVGPGVRGGQVFLVPGTVRLSPLDRVHLSRAQRRSLSTDVCLINIGGPAPRDTPCMPLSQIEHPLPVAIGAFPIPVPPRLSLAQARRLCETAFSKHPAERARCISANRHIRYAAPRPQPIVNAVVVHDGIASVDVYSGIGHPAKRLLFDVPVHNNVYAFVPFPHASGLLTLVFRDARGRVIPTAPIRVGTGKVVSTTGLVLRPPGIPGRANIPLIQTTTPNTVTGTGTVATSAP